MVAATEFERSSLFALSRKLLNPKGLLKRSLDQAPEGALEELKKAFATYARSDKFRAANKCADFEAERAAAISSVEVLLDFLLRVLPLPLPALR